MKPEYREPPPFEWSLFYVEMRNLQSWLEELAKAINTWAERPSPRDEDPEIVHQRTEELAKAMLDVLQRKPGGGGPGGGEGG